ncbi:uncharacterized protein LOC126799054 [Argentina anserina]|uniref:uncharacterized protein LOC126799054 n=1 Tax=Argentina anserina TaxID=57926 RepID=UPI0021765DB1|nr:uncharacterized protein LOC126799054 [Potentilla anserina]
MRRTLLRNLTLYARNPRPSSLTAASTTRLFSSDNNNNNNNDTSSTDDSSPESPKPSPESTLTTEVLKKDDSVKIPDITNKEMKTRMEEYLNHGKEEALPWILEAVLARKLANKHDETDDELLEDLHLQPLDNVRDQDFEDDFEEALDTNEEINDLYDAKDVVVNKMVKDEFFNMDEKKWDGMVQEAIKHGLMKDMKECEDVLEDMLSWDKLLPDDIKKKVEEKFNDLGDRCERGELEPEDAYKLFKEFEDEIVMEYTKKVEAQETSQSDEVAVPNMKRDTDDPPGEGPILRWQTRVVFAPGGDAWHPKNRKVKLSVTVKELGLSKHQFRRLRELVGKRYNSGKDELTITSERFEHREENRKDCLRTLLSLIEEAQKANKLAEDARVLYVKERLRANPAFMERLRNKTMRLQGHSTLTA